MRKLIAAVAVLAGCLVVPTVNAQSFDYHVYLNSDLRAITGCTVTADDGQSFSGVDLRLTATVVGSPPMVTELRLANCDNGSFAAGALIGGGYPVGLNNGVALGGGAFADVVELSVSRQQIPGALSMVSIGFGAQDGDSLDDGVFTRNGLPGGPPMAIGTVQLIPSAGAIGLLLLFALLLVVGGLAIRRNGPLSRVLLVSGCMLFSFGAWAAHFALDGEVDDWVGVAVLATDAAGDSPLSGTDIVAAYGVDHDPDLRFRIDVVDAENRPPLAVGESYSTREDTALTVAAPGVLGNDSDPDADPITAQLVTGPTRGTLILSADGSFIYTPNANANGSDSFTYNAFDGQVASLNPATVMLTVNAVNDAPTFTVGGPQTVLEDAGPQLVTPWATGISDADPEATQVLSFEVTANSNAALFSAVPAVSPTGALSYTPAANANGTATITLRLNDDGGTANGGVSQSATQTFTITVNSVNDAPTLTAVDPPTVSEEAGAQTVANWAAFTPGPANEAGQTVLGYQISAISNAALFAVPPAVAINGTLTYTPAANANGSSTFVARVQDSGGTANGGVDLSILQTFTITVSAINDVPSFTVGPNQTVIEDAGPQTVSPWATAINDGDPEVAQLLAFTITANTNPALFSAAPSVSPTGVLSYTPAANANGSATITLRLQDDGSNTPPNVNTSATQTFTITVSPINDAPSFTPGANQTVNEDAAAQTVNPWATAISAGPADEAGQTLTFSVTGNSNAALFVTQPVISPTGVLTYAPAPNASGVATITLTLSDNGPGAPPPNANTSASQTFTITVAAVNDAPVNTVPGAQTTGDTVPLVLSTSNTNALSVADIDAAVGILQMSFGTGAAANGTLTLANPGGVLTTLTGNGTEQVIATGTLTALNAALSGPSGSLTYTPVAGSTAARTITVITNDQGNTGSGGALIDTDTITVNVDAPPVVSSTPANGVTIANNAAITVNFSESVNVIAGIALNCGGAITLGGTTGSGVTSLNLSYTAPLPAGSCTLTVPAASVSDVDVIDPPQNPVANFVATFTVDAAPAVTTTNPVDGATTANNINLIVNFSEPVNFGAASFTLECASFTVGFTVSGTGTATATIDPSGNLPSGACTLTALAANITDVDGFDPPQNPVANSTINFTVDKAPAVVSSFPADGATNVPTNLAEVRFVYDEDMILVSSGPIDIVCGGSSISGGGSLNVVGNTVIRTLSVPLPAGVTCEITADATDVRDADLFDPPDAPIGDVIHTFTTDAAPSVIATNPVNGGIEFGLSSNLVVTFNEPVNFTASAFTLECPAATPIAFTASGSGSNTATINPTPATLPTNTACVFTVDAALVTDVDSADPPDAGTGVTTVNFTTVADIPPTAVANSASVLEDAAATAVLVLANDTDPDGGPISIGSVTQPTNGAVVITGGGAGLTYQPNPNYCNAPPGTTLDTFTYTLAPGGSTATVTMTVTCVDDSPVAVANSATVNEDSGATAIAVLANDTDTDAGPISVGSVTQPVNGTVVITGGGTGLTYQPDPNYCNNPPGSTLDTFTYTLTPGGSSATVTMTVTCVNDPPVFAANPIAYIAAGNTQLHVAGGSRPGVVNTVDAVGALAKSAATDADGPVAPTVVAGSGASVNGGNFEVFANGSFSYVPPAGFTGTDSFVVQVSDTLDSAALTVNVTVSQMVWYVRDVVDANNPAGGDGRSTNAVETLPAAALAAGENHTVFVFAGNTAATPLSGPTLNLRNGQKLHGEGVGLTLPTHGTLIPAGTRPRITNPAGSTLGVVTSPGSDRVGVEIRGLSISATGTAIRGLSNGAQNLGLLISDSVIENAGQRGIAIDHPSTGAATVALRDITITSTQAALDVNRAPAAGSMTITAFDDISVTGNSLGFGILVGGDPAFPVVFDATPGGAYNQVPGGVSSIGQSGNGIGNAGIFFNNVSGDLAYTDLDVYSDTGDALSITGTGVVNVGAGTGLRVTIGAGNGTLLANAGAALVLSSMTADMQLAALTSTTGSNGVSLTNVGSGTTASTISAPAGSAISNATGSDFAINGGNATVSYGGTISDASGSVVTITGATGGTKTFSGAIGTGSIVLVNNTGATINFSGGITASTGGSNAFSATGGGTVNVTGAGNSLSTTTGAALFVDHPVVNPVNLNFSSITASSGGSTHGIRLNNISGSVAVTGATSIGGKTTAGIEITNSTATVALSNASTVNIANRPNNGIRIANSGGTIVFGNTTINSSGVGTPAVRVDASSSAVTFAQTNINMNGAGGNENFLIGAGPSADAYTPRDNNGDGDAIYVTGLTGSLNINGGGITQPGDDGIDIRNSRNLVVGAMTFTEPGRSAGATCVDCNSSGIQAFGLTGVNSVTGSSFLRGRMRNFYISNPSGTTTVNVTGSTFDDTRGQGSPATDNMQIYASGTASAAFNISNSTFLKSATNQINAVAKDSATITELDITGITMSDDGGPSSGIRVDAEGASQIALNVIGNPVLYTRDENVITVSAAGTAQLQGRISNNPDMRFTTASAGGSVFGGIRALSDGTTSRVTLAITGNGLNVNNGTDGITLTAQGASAARIDASITTNTLTAAGTAGIPLDGINAFVNPTLGGTKVVCMTAANNTVNGIWSRAARARAFSPTGTYVTGYSGSFAATWIAQGNNSGAIIAAEFAGGGGVVSAPPVACNTPGNPMP